MFERFSDRARRALVLAEDEARMLQHDHIGTEHILLGLLQEGDGAAAQVLESLGISLETVREKLVETVSRGPTQAPALNMRYTPRAKKVLELSLREALQLGHHRVGTGHLLLGLLREAEGVAALVLVSLGADHSRVRQQLVQLLPGPGHPEGPAASGAPPLRSAAAKRRLSEILGRIDSMDTRLSAVEQRVGTGRGMGDLDVLIAAARRDKEAAAGTEDYERAAAARDRERQLLAERAAVEAAGAPLDLSSLAEDLRRLNEEVTRLRELLGTHGTEPHDGAA
jgi:Clp amino terminal domain, pathogenicity island component